VRPEAGIRGATGHAHARAEACRIELPCQARLTELARAHTRTEVTRRALAMSSGRAEHARGRATLNVPLNIERALSSQTSTAEEEGSHGIRAAPLTVDQLYIGPARPIDLTTTEEHAHQTCSVCLQVKSHPVSYVFAYFFFGGRYSQRFSDASADIAIAMYAFACGWRRAGPAPNAGKRCLATQSALGERRSALRMISQHGSTRAR
jgi:hypothetical protein